MYYIGVDLGGTNIAAGITDEHGNILIKQSTPTLSQRHYTEFLKDLAELCNHLISKADIALNDVVSIGIGSPGILHPPSGTLLFSNNLHSHNVPMAKEVQKYIDLPVFIDNDANCAALGESVSGSAKNFRDSVTITLGTGIGSGIIIDNKIYSGAFFGGGEAGHHVIVAGGEKCSCGRMGCWEAYASATALIRDAKNAAYKNTESLLYKMVDGDLEKMNAKIPFTAARQGDSAALALIHNYYKYLACGLTNIINIFQPEAIIIGGGISAQGDNLINAINTYIEAETYGKKYASSKTEILTASLGNDAGIIGAAMLAKYE